MLKKKSVLVVDDEQNILDVLKVRLEVNGFRVDVALSGDIALSLFKENQYSAVLLDMKMPSGMNGFEVMKELQKLNSDVPIIFLTAHGTIETAVKSMKNGAFYFLSKPYEADKLIAQVKEAVLLHDDRPRQAAPQSFELPGCFSGIIAKSEPMRALLGRVNTVLGCESTVLIHGESGTGKELIAKALHYGGTRKDKDFVVIDCGATSDSLLESELFGHVKGAFTNAARDKTGLFEVADGGTIFLDEVASISREMQKKLLRVIQEGEIRKVGSISPKKVDVRIISATNRDLLKAVQSGSFREDLYYRLNVLFFDIPPLRHRKEDIPIIAKSLLKGFAKSMGKNVSSFDSSVLHKMSNYSWPGNVRELRNFVESATAVSQGESITERDIASSDLFKHPNSSHSTASTEAPLPESQLGIGSESFFAEEESSVNLREKEQGLIVEALKKSNWVQKDAAKLLGISSRVINYKVRKFRIDCKSRTYQSISNST